MRKGNVCYGLTGGAVGNLDAIVSTSVTDNSIVLTIDTAKFYAHYYDSTSASAESSPDVIKPDNLGVGDAGRWLLLDVWTGLAALDAIGALTPAANKIPYFTSASAGALADLTAAARTLLALSATAGDLLYASGANTWANLAKGAANLKMFMNAGATAPEWASGVYVGSITRGLTAATGNVAYTGFGFKPSVLIAVASFASYDMSVGFDNITAKGCGFVYGTTPTYNTQSFLALINDGTNSQSLVVASFDADGFTGTWTKNASPTGTATVYLLALR